MLIFDELKKNDPQLRLVALVLAAGLGVLLAGLWWVQVVSANEYKSNLKMQAYCTVRIPATRGRILDHEGRVLAQNRPSYNLCLYFDDLSEQFRAEYNRLRPVQVTTNTAPAWKFWGAAKTVVTNRVRLDDSQVSTLTWQARYNVVNRIVTQVGQQLGGPMTLDFKKFKRSYLQERAMPFIILPDMNDAQIARFQEKNPGGRGTDMELQAVRIYPSGSTAAHLLGQLTSDDRSQAGEDSYFTYRLPDYRGVLGIEAGFDSQLRGQAGGASVLINNLGYRQSENIWSPPEPGRNLTLTIDLDLQRATEEALLSHQGANANAAAVVMDVRNGDVLAMASLPTFDPNDFAQGISAEKYQAVQQLAAEKNRATQENYAPGSIFKVVVGLAALEAGLNPEKLYTVDPDPEKPGQSCIHIGRLKKRDTAPPGDYNFKRAIERSSNSYFIQVGLETGVDRIVALADKFHLGEKANLPTRQETSGDLPTRNRIHQHWSDGDTANLCIGQGEVAVTPLQMAVAYSAIANGGTVFWPRLVSRIAPQDPASAEPATDLPAALVRDRLGVSMQSLRALHQAMLGETEDPEGTGYPAFHRKGDILNWRVCGKTGTAQVQNSANVLTGYNYWFASFAPYENPRYAVVVLVQMDLPAHGSGGITCAPIAHDIYEAILKKENAASGKVTARN